jgi:hypothetical protein
MPASMRFAMFSSNLNINDQTAERGVLLLLLLLTALIITNVHLIN